jgi:hypothetical protein
MKEPRVNDFDPNATPQLKSPMDDMPVIGKPPPMIAETAAHDSMKKKEEQVIVSFESTPAVPPAPPPVRTPVRTKRTITRYAFEFFQDQIETLKRFSLEEQLRGEKGSMSQMVREALDAFISKRRRMEE